MAWMPVFAVNPRNKRWIMRCKTILLLAFALAGSVRLAMAINDLPHYLFPYVPEVTDKPPLYYTKVCPVGKAEEGDAEYYIPSFVGREGRLLWASEYGIIPTVGKMTVNSYDR